MRRNPLDAVHLLVYPKPVCLTDALHVPISHRLGVSPFTAPPTEKLYRAVRNAAPKSNANMPQGQPAGVNGSLLADIDREQHACASIQHPSVAR